MGHKKLIKPGNETPAAAPQLDLGDRLMLCERWLVNNWRRVAAVSAVIVAAVIIWGIAVSVIEAQEDKAEEAFSKAKDAAELTALMAEYGDADCANYYRLVIAADAIAKNDLATAKQMHLDVAEKTDDTTLCSTSMLAAAGIMEKLGEKDAAIEKYAEVAGNDSFAAFSRIEANYQAGRIALSSGRNDEAALYLDTAALMGEESMNPYSDMAKQLLRTIR